MKFIDLRTNTIVIANDDALAKEYLKDFNYRIARDADFKESDHPRAKDGKFSSGGGGSGQSGGITPKSPEAKARHEKHTADTKVRSQLMKHYSGMEEAVSEKQKSEHKAAIEALRKENPSVVAEWEKSEGIKNTGNSNLTKQKEIHNRYKQLKKMDKNDLVQLAQSKTNIDMSHLKSEPAEEIRYHILNREFRAKDLDFDVRKEPK